MKQQMISNAAVVDAAQLALLLEYNILNRQPTLIEGRPGIGKTDIIGQVVDRINTKKTPVMEAAAARIGARMIVWHPVVDDPIDYKGALLIENGAARFIPIGDMNELIAETQDILVVMLDDLGQATHAVQAAAMQLILSRRINGFKISDNVVFVAATNGKEHRAGVTGILEPVLSRFNVVRYEPTLEDFIAWGIKQEWMPTELLAAAQLKPEWITTWTPTGRIENTPCPRNLAACAPFISYPEEIQLQACASRMGMADGMELYTYLKIRKSLPQIADIIADPASAIVPDEKSAQIILLYALVKHASKSPAEVMEYVGRFKPEWASIFISQAHKNCPEVFETRPYINWALTNGALILTN